MALVSNPSFVRHPSTDILYARLRQARVGEVVTYRELGAAIGADVQNGARGHLLTARRLAMKTDGYVFDVVTNQGLVRLSADQTVATASRDLRSIHRRARRMLETQSTVDAAELDNAARVKFSATLSLAGALLQASTPTAMKKIEGRVQEKNDRLSLPETLSLFAGQGVA